MTRAALFPVTPWFVASLGLVVACPGAVFELLQVTVDLLVVRGPRLVVVPASLDVIVPSLVAVVVGVAGSDAFGPYPVAVVAVVPAVAQVVFAFRMVSRFPQKTRLTLVA